MELLQQARKALTRWSPEDWHMLVQDRLAHIERNVNRYDLVPITRAYMADHNTSEKTAKQAEEAYRRLQIVLGFTAIFGRADICPTVDTRYWETHIQRTKQYRLFCETVHGRFIHRPTKKDASNDRMAGSLHAEIRGLLESGTPVPAMTRIVRGLFRMVNMSVDDWNLEQVTQSLMSRKLISWDEAKRYEHNYRQFHLTLWVLSFLGLAGAPSVPIDEYWHEHMIATEDYEAFCLTIHGHLVHHVPREEFAQDSARCVYPWTHRLRRLVCEEPPDPFFWPLHGADCNCQCNCDIAVRAA